MHKDEIVTNTAFCGRAIAYLKAVVPGSNATLSFNSQEPDSPVLKPLTPELCVAYVVDEGDRLVYVQQRHLRDAGMSAADLHLVGKENLQRLANEQLEVVQYGEIFAVLMGGCFEASSILLDDLWDLTLADCVKSGFAAVLPARDVLAFCDIQSKAGLGQLRQVLADGLNCDHPLSQRIFERRGTDWLPQEA